MKKYTVTKDELKGLVTKHTASMTEQLTTSQTDLATANARIEELELEQDLNKGTQTPTPKGDPVDALYNEVFGSKDGDK